MKTIIVTFKGEVDEDYINEIVSALKEFFEPDDDVVVEIDDTPGLVTEFNRLVTEIENEEAGPVWYSSP